jgi:hypothetical protein
MNEPPQACPHCGVELRYSGDAFCSDCGSALDSTTGSQGKVSEGTFRPDLLLPFNALGLVIIGASFLLALGLCHLLDDDRDTKLVIGGALALVADICYRVTAPSGHWFLPRGGGKFLYLPVWACGIFWAA